MARALKVIRKRKQLTQEQLAELAETSNSTISRIEGGSRNYSGDVIGRLADILGVPESVILMTEEQLAEHELVQEILAQSRRALATR